MNFGCDAGLGRQLPLPSRVLRPWRWVSFMALVFIWQFMLSGPLEIASGEIGLSKYAAYPLVHFGWINRATPAMAAEAKSDASESPPDDSTASGNWWTSKPVVERAIAFGVSGLAVILLYRRITAIGRLTLILWVAMLGTVLFMIVSGLLHYGQELDFSFPRECLSCRWQVSLRAGNGDGHRHVRLPRLLRRLLHRRRGRNSPTRMFRARS